MCLNIHNLAQRSEDFWSCPPCGIIYVELDPVVSSKPNPGCLSSYAPGPHKIVSAVSYLQCIGSDWFLFDLNGVVETCNVLKATCLSRLFCISFLHHSSSRVYHLLFIPHWDCDWNPGNWENVETSALSVIIITSVCLPQMLLVDVVQKPVKIMKAWCNWFNCIN